MPVIVAKYVADNIGSAVLSAEGLSYIGVKDYLASTSDPDQLFAPNVGARNQQDYESTLGYDRWSIGTHFGKKALKIDYVQGDYGYLRYNSLWLPTQRQKLGFRASMYIPGSFDLRNQYGANNDGKTAFGLICGKPDCYNPGTGLDPALQDWEWHLGGNDQVTVPSNQFGNAIGVNWKYWTSDSSYRFSLYPHAVGALGTGGVWRERVSAFSLLQNISGYGYDDGVQSKFVTGPLPRDRWFEIALVAQMDTSLTPPNGYIRLYIDGALACWANDLDLGGTVADRPSLGLVLRNDDRTDGYDPPGCRPDAAGPQGDLWSATGGGWGLHGIFARNMIGGGYDANHVPMYNSSEYIAEWELYADTGGGDQTPDAFSFTDQNDVALSTLIESDIVQVTGIADGTQISIYDGGFRIGNADMSSVRVDWGWADSTINNGEYIQVRQNSASAYSTPDFSTVTVGTYSTDWTVTTVASGSSSRTLNVSSNASLIFNPEQWQNGSMTAGSQNVPGTFAAVHHDAANGISECTLIDDSNFGVFPGTGAPVKVLRTHMFDPTGTPVDVGGGNRGEVYYAFANSSGNAIRYNAYSTGETYWYFGFMIDDAAAAWQTPSGFFKIIQHHDTSAHPGPSPDGGPWMIHINSSRQIYMRVRGGTSPSSGDYENLLISTQVPLNQWCHVIIKNIWSHVNGSALTQLWYRYDSAHTAWQNGPSTTRSNRYLVSGVADAPYLKMGVYREGEVSNVTNPYEAVIRSYCMVGSTLASVVPFQEWSPPA